MPNCMYCGKPAGLFRRYHVECRAQYDRATTTIPLFFEKLLDSVLPADRFQQLLKEVAATFHIGPDRLRTLSIEGINAMLDAALAQHLPTVDDEDRILEIAGALGFAAEDIPGLDDRLVKAGVLRDLEDGDIPDRVTVVGPMPVDLEPDETVVWIFNNIKTYRAPKAKDGPAAPASPAVQRDMPAYFSPSSLGPRPVQTEGMVERGAGDLLVTNRNLFIVANNYQRQIHLSRIAALNTYSDGFQIVRATRNDAPMTILVDDPWFAANLIVRLLRLSSDSAPHLEVGDAEVVRERPH
jgi:hypothetical protein